MGSWCQINLLDTEYRVQMINSDNHGWITVYGLSACFLPFEKSEKCAYKMPTVVDIDISSQFVLRNQSTQARKSLWEINTLTFLGSIDLEPHLSVFIHGEAQSANRAWVFPDVIPRAHPEFRLWKTEVRKVKKTKKTKQKTAYPSMAAQCLVSVFTACTEITIRAVQEEISCHLERMSDSLLTDLFI